MSLLILKTEGLYAAYLPEFGLVSYGTCREEAINNLADEVLMQAAAEPTMSPEEGPLA